MVEEVVTYLEMTSPEELVASGRGGARVEARRLGREQAALARETRDRVAAPLGWRGRDGWSVEEWAAHLDRDDVLVWALEVGGEVVGLAELRRRAGREVEIDTFGLVPEWQGRGIGGHALVTTARLAWQTPHEGGAATRRVWLHTSSHDHPHALANYERRGFRAYRSERRERDPAA